MLHWHQVPLALHIKHCISVWTGFTYILGFCIPWCSLCPFQRMLKACETVSYSLSLLHTCVRTASNCAYLGALFPLQLLHTRNAPLSFFCGFCIHSMHRRPFIYLVSVYLGVRLSSNHSLKGCIPWRAPIPSWTPIPWWAPIPWRVPIFFSLMSSHPLKSSNTSLSSHTLMSSHIYLASTYFCVLQIWAQSATYI